LIAAIMVSVGAAIAGIAVVQLANGFLGTLVSITSAAAGFTPAVVGIVLAANYGGYTIGAATVGPILQRVGHLRLFAALAGIVGPRPWLSSRCSIPRRHGWSSAL
jgi:hypothetical protein